MPTVLKFKTFPEILADSFVSIRALLGSGLALLPAQVLRSILEVTALSDAEQYVQIARLLDLFALDECKGDDIDRKARDYGSDFFKDLRRRPARTSISKISVSDGTLLKRAVLAAAVQKGATTFTVPAGTGSPFPTSGALVLERGTAREERIAYTRLNDTFTTIEPAALAFPHAINGEVLTVAIQSYITAGVGIGALSVTLAAGTGAAWPASGNVILDRDNANREKLAFTRVGDVLTIAATTFAHAIKATAILSTNGSDRAIASGLTCYAPATTAGKQVTFRINDAGPFSLLDGDYVSSLIPVESDAVGAATLVGASTISKWTSPPFVNATVTNPLAATRGADREKDDPYKARIKAFIQSLSRGTPLAIQTLVTGLYDETSNAEVAFAQVVEPVAPGTSILYITDGTSGFTLDQQVFAGRDVLIRDATAGDRRAKLSKYGPFQKVISPDNQRTPRLFKSSLAGSATSVGANYLEDTSLSMNPGDYLNYYLKTDDDQFFQITGNTGIRFTLNAGGATPSLGSYSVFDLSATPLAPDTDYIFNEATGDLELAVALAAHHALVAADDNNTLVGAYTYTSGLGAYVQRKVNGDPTDFNTFPGIRASGTKVLVAVPTVTSPGFVIQVVAAKGFTDAQLAPLVEAAVTNYVNSLGIGEDIVLAKIIGLVQAIPGVADVYILSPLANVPVPDGQMARDPNVQVA